MVGQPKHLHDLNKINADVRVTCRKCGFEVDWTVGELSRHLLAIGGNLTWSEITRHLRCRREGCGAIPSELRATAVPYARRQANLPGRIGKADAFMIEQALSVLASAVAKAPSRNVATLEVRLALFIVYIYARDRASVRAFWENAGNASRTVADTLIDQLHRIRLTLQGRGWLAPEPVVERIDTWGWQSPAPPGWRVAPGGTREAANDQPDA